MARVLRKKKEKDKKQKGRTKRVWNDKYPLEACVAGCYPLRQYYYWGSLFSMLPKSIR